MQIRLRFLFLIAWVDAAPTCDDVFIKGALMLQLSSLAGLFSEEHSIGISEWSCGNVGGGKTGVGPDLIGVALMNGLLFFKMIPDLDC